MTDRVIILAFAIFAAASGAAWAQAQVGTGINGGVCFGINCGEGAPPSVGSGINGGVCFGVNCGSIDQSQRSSDYQSSPSLRPLYEPQPMMPVYPNSEPNPDN